MAQLAERVLGKDEVAGPNPASSSKAPILWKIGAFLYPSFYKKADIVPYLWYN